MIVHPDVSNYGLDVGCGGQKRAGAIGVDLRRVDGVEIVADARMLPFRNESFDLVFSSHTIEHFSHREVRKVLAEWVRVLKKHGTIEIRCPDLRARAFLYSLNPTWGSMKNIYGEQDYLGNYHKSGFSFGTLKQCLEDLGIIDIKRLLHGYKGIPFIPDSLHIRGNRG
jgi:ubiquinone/menaquinone biosynthesis C-methylase UbiE